MSGNACDRTFTQLSTTSRSRSRTVGFGIQADLLGCSHSSKAPDINDQMHTSLEHRFHLTYSLFGFIFIPGRVFVTRSEASDRGGQQWVQRIVPVLVTAEKRAGDYMAVFDHLRYAVDMILAVQEW